jgi:hypothetical protein
LAAALAAMTQPFPISFLTAKPDMRGLFGLSLLIQCRPGRHCATARRPDSAVVVSRIL